jgi:hypothetical protein
MSRILLVVVGVALTALALYTAFIVSWSLISANKSNNLCSAPSEPANRAGEQQLEATEANEFRHALTDRYGDLLPTFSRLVHHVKIEGNLAIVTADESAWEHLASRYDLGQNFAKTWTQVYRLHYGERRMDSRCQVVDIVNGAGKQIAWQEQYSWSFFPGSKL